MSTQISELPRSRFDQDGFLVVRGLAVPEVCTTMREAVLDALSPLQGPAEFEADVGYPGSPPSRAAEGGNTPRRLLYAYARHPVFRQWARSAAVKSVLETLMAEPDRDPTVMVSQCHHNCVMTKHPGFSSETSWHQDIRYWSFDRPELVSVWLALGHEHARNGVLSIIPGSHRLSLDRGRLDHVLFLRTDLEENQALMRKAVTLELNAGDVLFFHSRVFHEAGQNLTDEVKLSCVFTYHLQDNNPIPGTRSALYPSVPL
ncbi:MAG: phytanoyl-CoA dioxygenase family protein [Gammaproteobacteria bacterium]|nr:phytanoyl-CoA dioxygenase family protein [Gammaproteobacteria bacterium]